MCKLKINFEKTLENQAKKRNLERPLEVKELGKILFPNINDNVLRNKMYMLSAGKTQMTLCTFVKMSKVLEIEMSDIVLEKVNL